MAKPSPTGVSREKIEDLLTELGEWSGAYNTAATSRLLQRLYEEDVITFNEFVFLDIDNWMRAFRSGTITVEEANTIHSQRPDQFVLVPVEYMDVISAHWNKYVNGPSGQSFGAAFGFDARRRENRETQGGQNTRERVKHCIRDLDLARRVVRLRYEREHAGEPISFATAYKRVAKERKNEGEKINAEIVQRAHKHYSEFVAEELKRDGLID